MTYCTQIEIHEAWNILRVEKGGGGGGGSEAKSTTHRDRMYFIQAYSYKYLVRPFGDFKKIEPADLDYNCTILFAPPPLFVQNLQIGYLEKSDFFSVPFFSSDSQGLCYRCSLCSKCGKLFLLCGGCSNWRCHFSQQTPNSLFPREKIIYREMAQLDPAISFPEKR